MVLFWKRGWREQLCACLKEQPVLSMADGSAAYGAWCQCSSFHDREKNINNCMHAILVNEENSVSVHPQLERCHYTSTGWLFSASLSKFLLWRLTRQSSCHSIHAWTLNATTKFNFPFTFLDHSLCKMSFLTSNHPPCYRYMKPCSYDHEDGKRIPFNLRISIVDVSLITLCQTMISDLTSPSIHNECSLQQWKRNI